VKGKTVQTLGKGRRVTTKVRKRKFNDQPDVFDHLATLLKKQRSQMDRLV